MLCFLKVKNSGDYSNCHQNIGIFWVMLNPFKNFVKMCSPNFLSYFAYNSTVLKISIIRT